MADNPLSDLGGTVVQDAPTANPLQDLGGVSVPATPMDTAQGYLTGLNSGQPLPNDWQTHYANAKAFFDQSPAGRLGSGIADAWNNPKDSAKTVLSGAGGLISNAGTGIKNFVGEQADNFGTIPYGLAMGRAAIAAGAGALSGINGLANTIESGVGKVTDILNSPFANGAQRAYQDFQDRQNTAQEAQNRQTVSDATGMPATFATSENVTPLLLPFAPGIEAGALASRLGAGVTDALTPARVLTAVTPQAVASGGTSLADAAAVGAHFIPGGHLLRGAIRIGQALAADAPEEAAAGLRATGPRLPAPYQGAAQAGVESANLASNLAAAGTPSAGAIAAGQVATAGTNALAAATTGGLYGLASAPTGDEEEGALQGFGAGLALSPAAVVAGGFARQAAEQEAANAQLRLAGARRTVGTELLPPELADQVNGLQGYYLGQQAKHTPITGGGTETGPVRFVVQAPEDFAAGANAANQFLGQPIENAAEARGYYTDQGSNTIYLNADHPDPVAAIHEAGHAMMSVLGNADPTQVSALHESLASSALGKDGSPTPNFQRFIDEYNGGNPVDWSNLSDDQKQYYVRELGAQSVVALGGLNNPAQFTMKPELSDVVLNGLGDFARKTGLTQSPNLLQGINNAADPVPADPAALAQTRAALQTIGQGPRSNILPPTIPDPNAFTTLPTAVPNLRTSIAPRPAQPLVRSDAPLPNATLADGSLAQPATTEPLPVATYRQSQAYKDALAVSTLPKKSGGLGIDPVAAQTALDRAAQDPNEPDNVTSYVGYVQKASNPTPASAQPIAAATIPPAENKITLPAATPQEPAGPLVLPRAEPVESVPPVTLPTSKESTPVNRFADTRPEPATDPRDVAQVSNPPPGSLPQSTPQNSEGATNPTAAERGAAAAVPTQDQRATGQQGPSSNATPAIREGQQAYYKGRAATVESINPDGTATISLPPTPTQPSARIDVPTEHLSAKTPRSFTFPASPTGESDVIDQVVQNGGILSKGRMSGQEGFSPTDYEGLVSLPGMYKRLLTGKTSPDRMASQLGFDTAGDMADAIHTAIKARQSARTEEARQAELGQQYNRFDNEVQTPRKTAQAVPVGDLSVGDHVNVKGQNIKVKSVDPDTGEVTLEDHTRYGLQRVQDGQTLYVESAHLQEPAADDFGHGADEPPSKPPTATTAPAPDDEPAPTNRLTDSRPAPATGPRDMPEVSLNASPDAPLSRADISLIEQQAEASHEPGPYPKSSPESRAQKQAADLARAKLNAVADAHAGELAPDDTRVQMRVNPETGKRTLSGTHFVDDDPFHQRLLGGDTEPVTRAALPTIQDAIRNGDLLNYDYDSAAETRTQQSAQQRRESQAASTASDRATGIGDAQLQNKSLRPLSLSSNADGSVSVRGFSPEKMLGNAEVVMDAMRANDLSDRLPYRDTNDPLFTRDVQNYVENHANGYKGDGSGHLTPVDGVNVPEPTPGYQPTELPPARAHLMNIIMGQDQTLGRPALKDGTETGSGKLRRFAAANDNAPTASGEVNPLRDELNRQGLLKAGPDEGSADLLHSVFETNRADLMSNFRDSNLPVDFTAQRGASFRGNRNELVPGGKVPNGSFAGAGFLPSMRDAKEYNGGDESIRRSGGGQDAQNSILAAKDYLRAGDGAGRAGGENSWPSAQELGDQQAGLEKWAVDGGLDIKPALTKANAKQGGEHISYYDPSTERWIKTTYPGKYGVIPAMDYDFANHPAGLTARQATPLEYLDRFDANNALFGDGVRLEGTTRVFGGISAVISQPDIQGRAATPPEIESTLGARGFQRVDGIPEKRGLTPLYYRKSDGTLISDATPDNFRFNDGTAVPIDVGISKATPHMREYIEQIKSAASNQGAYDSKR